MDIALSVLFRQALKFHVAHDHISVNFSQTSSNKNTKKRQKAPAGWCISCKYSK